MLFYRPRKRSPGGSKGLLLSTGLGVGTLAGFVGGLLGVGGGNIIVPALVAMGYDPKKASASASFVGSWLMTDRLNAVQVKRTIGLVLVVVALKMAWGLVS